MRAEHTRYEVPGWGVGDLWTGVGVVLAHELEFERDAGAGTARPTSASRRAASRAAPLEGAHGPPARTLATGRAQVGNGSAPTSSLVQASRSLDPNGLVDRFLAFFAGADHDFGDVPIELDWATPFQHSVASTLRAVPRGEVVAYGELASLAGYPGAGRAVGTFCAHNRFMLLVPCHRVVGATGLGGYGAAGLGVKRRLLELEGVRL